MLGAAAATAALAGIPVTPGCLGLGCALVCAVRGAVLRLWLVGVGVTGCGAMLGCWLVGVAVTGWRGAVLGCWVVGVAVMGWRGAVLGCWLVGFAVTG